VSGQLLWVGPGACPRAGASSGVSNISVMEVNASWSWLGDQSSDVVMAGSYEDASGDPGVHHVIGACTVSGLMVWYAVSVFDMYVYTREWAWVVGSCA